MTSNTHFWLLVSSAILATACGPAKPFSNLVFYDDFQEFDLSQWKHQITMGGGGNWEFQHYTNNRTNSYVKEGVLHLLPTLSIDKLDLNGELNIWGSWPANWCTGNAWYGCERSFKTSGHILNPIQSASIRSDKAFKYGKVEIRAKLPRGDWLWPAIWMMPKYDSYGGWPASGEIDLVESRGNVQHAQGGSNFFGSTLHWGPFASENAYSRTTKGHTLQSGDFCDDFHIFGLEWTSSYLRTYIDDPSNVVLNVDISQSFWNRGAWGNRLHNPWQGRPDAAPFDQEFFLIFNVGVGGVNGYFQDDIDKPWQNSDKFAAEAFWAAKHKWYQTWKGENASLRIDWVKVWQ